MTQREIELQAELHEVRRLLYEAQREAIIWKEAAENNRQESLAWMRRFVALQEKIAESQQ